MSDKEIQLVNSDGSIMTVSSYQLGKQATIEFVFNVLETMINSFSFYPQTQAKKFAELVKMSHRTLQGGMINFFLAVIYWYGKNNNWSDARNEIALESSHKIVKDLDDATIQYQPLI